MSVLPHLPEHPVVTNERIKRAEDFQLKIADAITSFAGSMPFVYVHVVVFAVWMLFFEKKPWPTLTLVVSLEAIFLSTFVMIGQNRAALSTTVSGRPVSFTSCRASHTSDGGALIHRDWRVTWSGVGSSSSTVMTPAMWSAPLAALDDHVPHRPTTPTEGDR